MPVNAQDARDLTYLARRLRTETHGARTWDEAGTYAAVVKFVGQNLAETVERITRHAADPEARTPAAIARPFVPDAQPVSRRDDTPVHLRCSTCDKPRARCEAVRFADDDHEFESAAVDLKRPPDAMAAIVTELRRTCSTSTPTQTDPHTTTEESDDD